MKMLRKSSLIGVVGIAGLMLAGCQNGAAPKTAAPGAVEVDVVTMQAQPMRLSVELPGRTAAFRIAEVRPQVGGIIEKRLFVEGSEVKAGQLLYQIDPATYQAAFDSAKANLAKAEAQEQSARLKAERYRVLVRTKAVSEQEQIEMEAAWKQAQADVAAAKAAVASARINLDYTKVTAPITGQIGKSTVTEGALVTAQQSRALATIQQLDPMYVDVNQSSTELLALKREVAAGLTTGGEQAKSEVSVILDDGNVYGKTGSLQFSDVTVNQTTGSVTLRAIVANPDHQLLPGLFVRARIDKGQQPAALLVPSVGISRNSKGQATVMVVNQHSTAENRVVQTGQNIGDRILVRQGLQPGDRVIVSGLQKIRTGAEVKPVEKQLASGERTASTLPTANQPASKVE